MSIEQPGDTKIISPLSVNGDAGPSTRAESVIGGFAALTGSGPPDAARLPIVMRRAGQFAYTPTDGKFWQLIGGTADGNWVQASFGVSDIAPVAAATTGNITLSGLQTIDGVVTPTDVLVWKQTTGSQNGIYTPAAGAWVRRSDQDASSEFRIAAFFLVSGGTVNGGKLATYVGAANPTLGVTSIQYGLTFPSPIDATDDNKFAVASGGTLRYATLADASIPASFGSKNVSTTGSITGASFVTTGSVAIGSLPAGTGGLRVNQGFTAYGRTVAATDRQLWDWGSTAADTLTLGTLATETQVVSAFLNINVSGVVSQFNSASVNVAQPLIQFITGPAEFRINSNSSPSGTGGKFTWRGQNMTGVTSTGGELSAVPGTGTSINGNLSFMASPVSWQSMGFGLFIGDRTAAPTGNPTAGHFHWSEGGVPADRTAAGNITIWSMITASSASAGAATALPALPAEYATVTYNGNVRKLPLYAS